MNAGHRSIRLILLAYSVILLSCGGGHAPIPSSESTALDQDGHPPMTKLRVATFNVVLNRPGSGELTLELSSGESPQAQAQGRYRRGEGMIQCVFICLLTALLLRDSCAAFI